MGEWGIDTMAAAAVKAQQELAARTQADRQPIRDAMKKQAQEVERKKKWRRRRQDRMYLLDI